VACSKREPLSIAAISVRDRPGHRPHPYVGDFLRLAAFSWPTGPGRHPGYDSSSLARPFRLSSPAHRPPGGPPALGASDEPFAEEGDNRWLCRRVRSSQPRFEAARPSSPPGATGLRTARPNHGPAPRIGGAARDLRVDLGQGGRASCCGGTATWCGMSDGTTRQPEGRTE